MMYKIYVGTEGYNNVNKILEEVYNQNLYNYLLSNINWRQNKKYFNDQKKKEDKRANRRK